MWHTVLIFETERKNDGAAGNTCGQTGTLCSLQMKNSIKIIIF
jgi:hypothetical protein